MDKDNLTSAEEAYFKYHNSISKRKRSKHDSGFEPIAEINMLAKLANAVRKERGQSPIFIDTTLLEALVIGSDVDKEMFEKHKLAMSMELSNVEKI